MEGSSQGVNTVPVMVTGAAGFIGFHVARRLLELGQEVVGVDVVNDYYDQSLKEARLAVLARHANFSFHRFDLADRGLTQALMSESQPERVIHLAAQAGVRYSLENPEAYISSNIVAFSNILESCRHNSVEHLTYASSSSVYGLNTAMPFSVQHNVDHPVSLYGASKKANELMAHAYSHLFGLPTTGLRFFTVYGPWGRPDMAMFIFVRAMLRGQPIKVFNHGRMRRDFTFVDDVVEGVIRVSNRTPSQNPRWDGAKPEAGSSKAPFRLYNIGNSEPVELMDVISILERELGVEAKKEMMPLQAGDVPATYADVEDLNREIGFRPATPIDEGIRRFISWYREYYKV